MGAPIHVVLGTAGHIDHGKTTLIRALTGVDTDRLPEEKKRGITIVLGFAPLDLAAGVRVGVVDVPGHERFVKNMVAGAGGIDVVLLVVAADEGVMPQTREHVEICEMLGISRGVVALTKIDRAGELAELAVEDVRDYLAKTRLADAPIIPCSSTTGEGLAALKAALMAVVERVPAKSADAQFILPIDRMFSVKGFGSVVTGTLLSGSIASGDEVAIVPAVPGKPPVESVRVRSVEVFSERVERAHAGDRTALSLQGVDLEQLARGQIVIVPGTARPTRVIDAHVEYLASRDKPLKTGAKALFHIGTGIVQVGLTLLDADRLEPGASGYARLRLAEPVAALPGQRFILRGFEAITTVGRTIGGGRVLDPEPPKRRPRNAEATLRSLTAVDALFGPSPASDAVDVAATALVQEHGVRGVQVDLLARRLGRSTRSMDKALTKAKAITRVADLAVDAAAIDALGATVLSLIDAFHAEHPFRGGMPVNELASRVGATVPKAITERAAKSLVGKKKLASGSEGFHRPDHQQFGASGAESRAKVLGMIDSGGLEPPALSAMEEACGLSGKALRELLAALVKTGDLVRVTPKFYLATPAFEKVKADLLTKIAADGEITTATAKELTGISRKYLIPLLEALDRMNVTVRVGEARKAR